MDWQLIREAKNLDGIRLLLWVPPYGPTTGHYDHGGWHLHSILNKEAEPTHFATIEPPSVCGDPECCCFNKPPARSCNCQ